MTPSMVESIANALDELGVPARSKDLRDTAKTLRRLFDENDRLRGALKSIVSGAYSASKARTIAIAALSDEPLELPTIGEGEKR